MHAFLSNSTAVLLVIHAMIGCCHHHWHSDAECTEAITICGTTCQCSDHRDATHDDGEQPDQPCDGDLECHGVCSYVPTQKTVIDASDADGALDFVAAISTPLDGRLAAAAPPWGLARAPDDSPPLRLHLLHQILLI